MGWSFVGGGWPEANKAEAFGLWKAGSEQELASRSGWGVETSQ
jgi:hypothetical protein